ncbi:hypothetical protein [Niabella hirudinis]|uniref:hypothetical protein n=1 Tax=Niabella hirudinis TaxID=1285929 RepID=UPI003EB89245
MRVVNLTEDIKINGGNKYAYIHLWRMVDYPSPAWAFGNGPSGAPKYANGGVLSTSLLTLVLNYSLGEANVFLANTYPPDTNNDFLVQDANDGVTFTKTPGNPDGSTRFVFSNIRLAVKLAPGETCDPNNPPTFKGDSWSAQDDKGKNPACWQTGIEILPVQLENIAAVKKDNQIEISWTTASENNSREFVVEGSRDNVNWTAIGKLESKAVNGISTQPLNYTLVIGLPVTVAALGIAGLFLLTLVRSRWARALALVIIIVVAGACLKDGKSVDVEKGEVGYIRIAQYDKDSNIPAYSKVIKVVND